MAKTRKGDKETGDKEIGNRLHFAPCLLSPCLLSILAGTRSCAIGLGTTSAPAGVRLHAIALRHLTFAFFEQVLDVFERRFIEYQLDACNLGHNFARQIVERGAQSAGRDYEIGAGDRDTKRVDVFLKIVRECRVPVNGDADFRETQAKPLAIGVEILARRELGADGDDFRFHR